MAETPLQVAVMRILRPLVRVLIGRRVPFPELADWLKDLYVAVAAGDYRLDGKRVTDSRVSLMTGLQRKDVKAVRARLEGARQGRDAGAGPLPRVMTRWQASSRYCTPQGDPSPLPRYAEAGKASFETLVAEVSRDIHPRTVLDELLRLGLVELDHISGLLQPTSEAFLPSRDDEALLGYFGANLGDHAEASAANVLAAPEAGPFFERAVHYNRLTARSLEALEQKARRLQQDALLRLNAEALALQQQDRGKADATGRFRCGAFIYRREAVTHEEAES